MINRVRMKYGTKRFSFEWNGYYLWNFEGAKFINFFVDEILPVEL